VNPGVFFYVGEYLVHRFYVEPELVDLPGTSVGGLAFREQERIPLGGGDFFRFVGGGLLYLGEGKLYP
jgi:hypothetical protein